MMKFKFELLIGAAVHACIPTGALAQAAPSDETEWADDGGAESGPVPGEIIVTAQRRSENIQNVPIAIAAFTGDMVEAGGSTDITDLNGLAPNVVLQAQGLIANVPMVSIRGMSSADPDPNNEPKASTIIDGIYTPFAVSTLLDMFDIERIEILKGPQGVLFGKNNLAGTISVTTSKPTVEAGGELRATLGSFGLRQLRGKVNSGEFANGLLALKLAFNIRDYDGYTRNILTGTRLNGGSSKALRGALSFNPTSNIDSTLVVDWLKEKTLGPAPHVVDNGSAAYQQLPLEARTDIRKTALTFDPFANTKTYGGSWTTNFGIGDGTITLVTGYRHLDYLTKGDFDGLITPDPSLEVTRDFKGSTKSAELRYVSPKGELLDYVVGLFFETDKWHQITTNNSTPTQTALSDLNQETTSYAGFALVNFRPLEGLTLSAGGRYSRDEKDYDISTRVTVNNVFVPSSSFEGSFSDSWEKFTPRLTAEYRFSPTLMAYANYSQGYKAGGYNSRGTVRENVGPYNPETVKAYELGIKSDLFDRLLRFNVAGFLNRFSNLQTSVTKQGALRPENVTINVASVETYGIEVESTLRPTDNFTLGANFAWLHAKYTDFCADTNGVFTNGAPEPRQCGEAVPILLNGLPTGTFAVPVDSTNLDLGNAPKYTASVTADYRFPISIGEIAIRADARYSSRYNTWGRSNLDAFYRDKVVLVNGSISFTKDNDAFGVSLYGRNLTNRKVMSGALVAGTSPITQYYQAPREFGIDISAKF